MIFHENRLLADDSHETSFLYFFLKWGKMLKNLSPAAVVIGALRVSNEHNAYTLEHQYTVDQYRAETIIK